MRVFPSQHSASGKEADTPPGQCPTAYPHRADQGVFTSDVRPARDFSARAARTCSSVSGLAPARRPHLLLTFFFSGFHSPAFLRGLVRLFLPGPVRQRPPPPANCPPRSGDRIPRPEEVSSYSCASLRFCNLPDREFLHRTAWNNDRRLTLSPSRKRMNRSARRHSTLTAPLFTGFFEHGSAMCFPSHHPLLSEGFVSGCPSTYGDLETV